MNTSRVQRILKLLTTFHAGAAVTVEGLAKELGVTRRTVFRDLAVLEDAGVPFQYDRKQRRYRIRRDFFIPPINFSLVECLTLMFLTHKMLNEDIWPEHAAATRAAIKLESALPAELREHCEGILSNMDINLLPMSPADGLQDQFHTFQRAVAEHRKVEIEYEPPDKPAFVDTLHPYHLAFINRGWYVIGLSEQAGQARTFKIERIVRSRPLEQLFVVDERFVLSDYLGNAWQMIRGHKRYNVQLKFAPKVATNVEEVIWHKTQTTMRKDDDSLLFEVEVDGIDEISWWVMGYADQVEVVTPPELRQMVAQRAKRICQLYDNHRG